MEIVRAMAPAILAAAVVVGCSGEGDTLTGREFVTEVNSLCRKAERGAEPHLREMLVAVSNEDYPTAGDALEEAVEASREIYEEIAAVDAPAEHDAAFSRFLELQRQLQTMYALTIEGLREDGVAGLDVFADRSPAQMQHRVASRLGLTDCTDPYPDE